MRVLGAINWVCIVLGTAAAALHPGTGGTVAQVVVVPATALIFLILVLRLVVVAMRESERRAPVLCLALAIVLWAAGSTQISTAPDGAATAAQFPAPGEWLFLSSFLALAAYLFLDVGKRIRPSLTDGLEACVASGGAICLVAVVLATPFADDFARQGVPLLVALMYPALDAVLIAVVVAQLVLRRRAVSRASVLLIAGLVLVFVADTVGSVVNLTAGTYAYGLLEDLAWCVGYVLVGSSACRPRREPKPPREGSPAGGQVTLVAAGTALGALALQPDGAARPYVIVPALVTFAAAAARLVLALREARGAAEAYRLSRTDELTGLPNRRAVISQLAGTMAGAQEVAVALLDLDGFKEINDSLGHGSGDTLLQIIARRLRHALPENVLVARLSSDEFAVLATGPAVERMTDVAEDMRRLVRRPILLDGLEVSVEASVGIAVRSQEVATKGDLLRCADVAMVQAKGSQTGIVLYNPDQDEYSRSRLALAEELRHGLERGELVVWYQPQIEAATGEVSSVEALIRWRHPTQGLLAPFAFLPAARRAGLMPRLTEVVLASALHDLSGWLSGGHDISVAVNMAPPELLGGTVLPELGSLLAGEQVPPERLIIEVTEDSFLADPAHARVVIEELRARGVQVSIDDYGTGFSSLAYLRNLPLQELKIDRSFVADILTDERSSMIIRTTAQLAHGLGLRVVAEGVEDEAQRAELTALGVDLLQGYLFARPMPAEHLESWLRARSEPHVLMTR